MSKITMYAGDEYRAKIETDPGQEAFFSDVYYNAESIVEELVAHVQRYWKAEQEQGRQYRIGNNIIAFCGQRGQGKTSAMQTFSYSLKGKTIYKKEIAPNGKFYVLSSIDPSALRTDESIVRILISKLFNDVSKLVKDSVKESVFQEHIEDIRASRDKLLKCFESCFRNVDYSVKDNREDFGMDDLELLSQLGSSNMLRESLQALIFNFLDFVSKYNNKKETYEFVVIQIDDADMALDGVFKICEDIRNYFSLPNVIVLMAADMEQLTNAILQEYIKKYHELISTESDQESRAYHIDNCIHMANRYVEKMFPTGHRIELPLIQSYIEWNFNSIRLEYFNYDDVDIFKECNESCKDMQEQLFKKLYDCTGVIFLKNDQSLHSLLPRTMRELTHFVKMLAIMPTIYFQNAFTEKCEETKKLQNNLTVLENYFFDYWCANHLQERSQIELRKLHYAVVNKEPTIEEILSKCENDKNDAELCNAYKIYYTILLNKKFVEATAAVDKKKLYSQLADYLNSYVAKWDDLSADKLYKILKYDYIKKDTRNNAQGTCNDEIDNNIKEVVRYPFIYDRDDIGVMKFDVSKAILISLKEYEDYQISVRDENAAASVEDTHDDTTISKNIEHVIGLKHIFANIEVYCSICDEIKAFYAWVRSSPRDFCTLSVVYKNLFQCMNLKKYNVEYLNILEDEIRLGDFWSDLFAKGKQFYIDGFWENEKNHAQYEVINSIIMQEVLPEIDIFYDDVLEQIQMTSLKEVIFSSNQLDKIMSLMNSYDEKFKNSDDFKNLKKHVDFLNDVVKKYNESIVDTDNENEKSEMKRKDIMNFSDIRYHRNEVAKIFKKYKNKKRK